MTELKSTNKAIKVSTYEHCYKCGKRWYGTSTTIFGICPFCKNIGTGSHLDTTEGKLPLPKFNPEDYQYKPKHTKPVDQTRKERRLAELNKLMSFTGAINRRK